MQNDKRFSSYALIFLGLTILVFFTRGAYAELQVKLSEKDSYEATVWEKSISAKEKRVTELEKIQKDMADPESEASKQISKYTKSLFEDELLVYFYGYAEWVDGDMSVESLNIDRQKENEYGFGEASITLDVTARSANEVMVFLREILDETADYRFFIENIDIPDQDEDDDEIAVSIPLKMFYK